jgi:hypothetical protein
MNKIGDVYGLISHCNLLIDIARRAGKSNIVVPFNGKNIVELSTVFHGQNFSIKFTKENNVDRMVISWGFQ